MLDGQLSDLARATAAVYSEAAAVMGGPAARERFRGLLEIMRERCARVGAAPPELAQLGILVGLADASEAITETLVGMRRALAALLLSHLDGRAN